MKRKYKLKIPEMIKSKDACIYEAIRRDTFAVTGEDWSYENEDYSFQFKDIPKDWLEELYPCAECGCLRTKAEGGTTFTVCDECWDKAHPKEEINDEPMNVKEAMKRDYPCISMTPNEIEAYTHGFSRGAAENEKKHKAKQTFREWNSTKPFSNMLEIYKYRFEGWNAHAKATNTEA